MQSETREVPGCPKCGYDQSGAIAAWTDCCPLHGVCSECGHEFEFARVLNTARYRIPWFFEHTAERSRWGLWVRAPWRTWVRAMAPWRFWRHADGVRLDSEFSAVRLWLWLPLLMLPLVVVAAILDVAGKAIPIVIGTPGRAIGIVEWMAIVANGFLRTFGLGYFDRQLGFYSSLSIPFTVTAWALCAALMPAMILTLSSTRLTCRIRDRHVLRAAVYGLAMMALWPLDTLLGVIFDIIPWPPAVVRSPIVLWWFSAWQEVTFAFGLLGVSWFAIWWYVVLVRAFRLTHARTVWALLMVACLLAFLIVASLGDGLNWLWK